MSLNSIFPNPSLDYLPNEDQNAEFAKGPKDVVEVVDGWNESTKFLKWVILELFIS